jgi:hypothetical protein
MISKLNIAILLFFVAQQAVNINGDIFDDIGNSLTNAGKSICGTFAGAFVGATYTPCQRAFEDGIRPYLDEQGDAPSFAVCCQINILESCIARKVEETCGSGSGDAVKSVTRAVLQTANYLSEGRMDCVDHIQYRPESPLCWPIPAQVAGAILLAIILISCCCCCVCCRRRNGRVHGHGFAMVSTPTQGAAYKV